MRFCDFRTQTGSDCPVFYYICIKYSHHGRELSRLQPTRIRNDDPRKREQVDPRLPYRHHHPGGDPGCHHGLYYNIHRQQQADYDLLVIDRDSIQNNLSDLMQDFDDLQLSNDTLSLQMGIERQRADSLMQRLKQERSWSLAKIKQYEKEVGTLRTIMRGYLHQIDSLNTLNKKLIDENVSYRKEITTAQMRAEMAEEKAQELNNKVRQGSVITPGVSAW